MSQAALSETTLAAEVSAAVVAVARADLAVVRSPDFVPRVVVAVAALVLAVVQSDVFV